MRDALDSKLLPRREESIDKTFITADGRKSTVRFLSEELIGKGFYGNVLRVRASVKGDGGREAERRFVLKRFHEKFREKGRAIAERSLQVHDLLQELGIRTWTTYRIAEEGNEILMTDGELKDNARVFSQNRSESRKVLEQEMVPGIANLEAALEVAISDVTKATRAAIYVGGDSWMIELTLTDGDDLPHARFFIGDMDRVMDSIDVKNVAIKSQLDLASENLGALRKALRPLLRVVEPKESSVIEKWISSRIDQEIARVESDSKKEGGA